MKDICRSSRLPLLLPGVARLDWHRARLSGMNVLFIILPQLSTMDTLLFAQKLTTALDVRAKPMPLPLPPSSPVWLN